MERIPVLFLEPTLPLGGAERVLYSLVTGLDRDRFRPIVCCLKAAGRVGEEIAVTGIPVHHDLLSHRYSPTVFPKLVKLMHDEGVLVVHTIHQPLNNFWAVVAGRIARVPVVVSSVHGTRSTLHRGRALMLDRVLGPRIDAVVALANMHRDYLVAEQGMNPSKVIVIPNGIDLGRFRGGSRLRRSDLGLPEGVPIAGVLAVLRPEKAHDNFLRAAALVLKQFPMAHFVLIGDGPQREYLESLTRSLDLDNCVHFLGRRDDIDQILPLIDVSVLPSRTEAFPLSVLEAMATGRPVVVTDVGALREMVSPGVTGLIVPPDNVEELAAGMARLFGDPDLAYRLGQAGLAWVEDYDVSRMVRRMEDLFVTLLNEKTTQPALARA